LQFQPPFEEIRLKYYNHLKKLLSIPVQFRGIDGIDNTLFVGIVERCWIIFICENKLIEKSRNGHLLKPLFERAEELFSKLKELLVKFEKWIALGSVDLFQLAEQKLQHAEDWDKNFRSSKAWGQEIARLTK
jgi:dynein heavy chain 2, cytosolic